MKTKKKKSIWILLGVFVLLLLTYVGLQIWTENKEKEEEEKALAEAIYVTNLNEITEITYNIGAEEISFVKEADIWYDQKDKAFPLLQSYPEQIVEVFQNLKAERSLENGDELADYGLDNPTYTVVLTDSEGTVTKIEYGNTMGETYYVTVDDTKNVYTVNATTMSIFTEEKSEMAQFDTYPSIGSGNLQKVTITEGDLTTIYDSEKEEDAEGIAAVAGGLGAVNLTKAADYSVKEEELEHYGLTKEQRTEVEVKYTSNEADMTMMLYIGGVGEDGNCYVMINDSRIVYLISEEVCKNIVQKE